MKYVSTGSLSKHFSVYQGGNRGDNEEEEELDDSKFDEFMGNDSGMLAGTFGEYDEDDKEADEIWEAVDQHMDLRRRVR